MDGVDVDNDSDVGVYQTINQLILMFTSVPLLVLMLTLTLMLRLMLMLLSCSLDIDIDIDVDVRSLF